MYKFVGRVFFQRLVNRFIYTEACQFTITVKVQLILISRLTVEIYERSGMIFSVRSNISRCILIF